MKFAIRLSYNGAPFCGWQQQKSGTTIQGELQNTLSMLLGTGISVTGAGRTDTGVNAVNYIAHFETPDEIRVDP